MNVISQVLSVSPRGHSVGAKADVCPGKAPSAYHTLPSFYFPSLFGKGSPDPAY